MSSTPMNGGPLALVALLDRGATSSAYLAADGERIELHDLLHVMAPPTPFTIRPLTAGRHYGARDYHAGFFETQVLIYERFPDGIRLQAMVYVLAATLPAEKRQVLKLVDSEGNVAGATAFDVPAMLIPGVFYAANVERRGQRLNVRGATPAKEGFRLDLREAARRYVALNNVSADRLGGPLQPDGGFLGGRHITAEAKPLAQAAGQGLYVVMQRPIDAVVPNRIDCVHLINEEFYRLLEELVVKREDMKSDDQNNNVQQTDKRKTTDYATDNRLRLLELLRSDGEAPKP